jgi:hypothetical protein
LNTVTRIVPEAKAVWLNEESPLKQAEICPGF